jgi:DNA mismatch endonuclease (patch repair protein)
MLMRRALHAAGLRYRVGLPVPGRPRRTIDIAFPGIRLAVFVDGCFWHGCPTHRTWPKTNAEWWLHKIDTNRSRDAETDQILSDHGWRVIRVWEHGVPDGVQTIVAEFRNLHRGAA